MLRRSTKSSFRVSNKELTRYLHRVKGIGRPNAYIQMRQHESTSKVSSPLILSYEESPSDHQNRRILDALFQSPKARKPLSRSSISRSIKSSDDSVNIIHSDAGRVIIPIRKYHRELAKLRTKKTIKEELKIKETEEMHRRFKVLVEKICPSAKKRTIRVNSPSSERGREQVWTPSSMTPDLKDGLRTRELKPGFKSTRYKLTPRTPPPYLCKP